MQATPEYIRAINMFQDKGCIGDIDRGGFDRRLFKRAAMEFREAIRWFDVARRLNSYVSSRMIGDRSRETGITIKPFPATDVEHASLLFGIPANTVQDQIVKHNRPALVVPIAGQ
jgi:hypothetical protein